MNTEEQPLRGISNSLGDYRKRLKSAFAAANDVALLLMSVGYPRDSRPLLSDSPVRNSFLEEVRIRFPTYVWNEYLLWKLSRDLHDKHGREQTFPEFGSHLPDKESGLSAFVFDLYNVMRNDSLTFLPRQVPRRWHESGRWLDFDLFLGLDELRSLRYTKPGASEYAMTLVADVSVTELHHRFNSIILSFGCWFEAELRRVVLMTMGGSIDT